MEEQTEKSCWGVTFWAVAIAVLVAGLVTLSTAVDVADSGEEGIANPAAVASKS